jgi:KipI family sensor histidine kinase inhibitor
MALHAAIGAAKIAGVVETVPSMRALMVCYDPMATSRARLEPAIEGLIARGLPTDMKTRQVTIPCCYDDKEFAPDLPEVAERTKKKVEDVIRLHLASRFKVYVLGFMPGLAYIAGLEKSLYLPRRSQPRVRVPRSTVAIAMDMTTIYPFESPGGWHLIGRTPLWMFDKRREQPVFFAPGDVLTFQRISRTEFDAIARRVEAGTLDWSLFVTAP